MVCEEISILPMGKTLPQTVNSPMKKFPVSALAALQRQEGMPVKVTSLRGSIILKVKISKKPEKWVVFIPFPL